jgi:hypothetical protein
MAKFLRIALWNANGIAQHKNEIHLFLQHNKIDMLLISETHVTTKTHFKIPHYNIYYTNHADGSAHGVTAVLVNHTIRHHELPKYEEDFLQATSTVFVSGPGPSPQRYLQCTLPPPPPPKHNLKKCHYEAFFSSTLGSRFMAGGDYNSKHTVWGSRITFTKGRELLTLLHKQNYSFLSTGHPTYWPTDPAKQPDLLDFFVTNGMSSTYTAIEPSYDLFSDHSPVIATISTSPIYVRPTPRLHISKTNWHTYRSKLQEDIILTISLKNYDEVEKATHNFIRLLQDAARQTTPPETYKNDAVNISLEIKKLLAEKRKARAKWQRSHAPRQDGL